MDAVQKHNNTCTVYSMAMEKIIQFNTWSWLTAL